STLAIDGKRFKVIRQDVLGVNAKPVLQNRSVDTAEISGHLRFAILQVGETGYRSRKTAAHARTRHEDGAGRAVVGSGGAVLLNRAAELAEREQRHAFRKSGGLEILEERSHGAGKFR